MFLQFLANQSDVLLVVGLFGLLTWCVAWLARRGVTIWREGTYYRTYIHGLFEWHRVHRYGLPVRIAGGSSIGGAAVMVIMVIVKAAAYPLAMPYLWKIPFEALWQGLPIPILGYMLAEWVHTRQMHRKRKRAPVTLTDAHDADLLTRVQRLELQDDTPPTDTAAPPSQTENAV